MMHLPIQQHVNPSRNRNLFSTIPHLKVFGYLIATIAAVLGASVEGIAQPLKETHRVCLYVFLVAVIVQCIAFVAQRNQANHSHFWGLIAVICGSLSAVSLIAAFFTHSVAEIICYIALGCAAIIIVVYQYGSMFINACRRIYDDILGWFPPINIYSTEQQQRPADDIIEEV
ncbi:uncharacterized protein LOC127902701 isoform X1 [Citrus sinensis]|uniref:uncharacterized protein LOC127902701 isoform X1 n=1 Tax=Citrus sinensis TaxID=2711 RepID=UPI0022778358|nr:uncharacterized protein LOC127902701 isoform X1 [Citrus sinensis]